MPDKDKKKEKAEVPGIKAWLENLDITEVSLVKSPWLPCSPEAQIQITKAFTEKKEPERIVLMKAAKEPELEEGQVKFQKRFRIQKIDSKERKIYGYVYPSNKADLVGDAMTPEELEKAAHSLLINLTSKTTKGEGAGLNHEIFENIFKFTESAIDHDGAIGKAHGFFEPMAEAWFIGGWVPNDDIWKSIESGETTGFSWSGIGDRKPVAEAEQKAGILKSAFNSIKSAITKGEPMDFAQWQNILEAGPKIDDMIWTLGDVIFWIMWDDKLTLEEKTSFIKRSILQFYQAVTVLFNSLPTFDLSPELASLMEKMTKAKESLDNTRDDIDGLLKTFDAFNKGEEDMTSDELKKAVGETFDEKVAPINETLKEHGKKLDELDKKFTDLEKKAEPPEEGGEDKTKGKEPEGDSVAKTLSSIQKSVEDIGHRIEKLEKTPGIRKSETNDSDHKPDGELTESQKAAKGTAFSFSK